MRVFVAGATGAIGRPLVRQLVAAGHEVTGTTRREERVEDLRRAGATPVVCDALDAGAVREAVATAAPEVVIHQLTALPDRFKRGADFLTETNRLRTEGTRNLVAAAQAAGARRLIAQSIAFAYQSVGDPVKEEDAPLETAEGLGRVVAEHERRVLEAEGLEGIVLRYGYLYGPGTWYSREGSQSDEVRRRRTPIVGKGDGVFSWIHVEDAASATVAALDRGAPGVYNVVDDDPAPMREWLPAFAEAVGAPKPRRAPLWLVRLVGGRMAAHAANLRGASNAKAKRELGWAPRYASWRLGFREGLG